MQSTVRGSISKPGPRPAPSSRPQHFLCSSPLHLALPEGVSLSPAQSSDSPGRDASAQPLTGQPQRSRPACSRAFIFKAAARLLAPGVAHLAETFVDAGSVGYLQSGVPGGHLEASCGLALPPPPCPVWATGPLLLTGVCSKVPGSSASQGPVRFLPESLPGLRLMFTIGLHVDQGQAGHCTGATEGGRGEEARRKGIVSGHQLTKRLSSEGSFGGEQCSPTTTEKKEIKSQ